MVQAILDAEYANIIASASAYNRTQYLYTIISVKIDNPTFNDHGRSLYADIKEFVKDYVASIDSLSYGYDMLDLDKIFKTYNGLQLKEAIAINNFFLRMLKSNGFEEEYKTVLRKRNELQIKMGNQIFLPLKWILYHSSKSFGSLIVSTLIFLGLICLILLPTHVETLQVFKITYYPYSGNFFLNHAFNLICAALEIGEGFSITPLNLFGLILLILGKLTLIIIIGNFLIQEITRKLSD